MEQEPKTPRERAADLISLLVPYWRPTPQQVLWAIRIGIVLSLLFAVGYAYGISLWDWIKLLIVPAAIAGAGLWFNQQQQERQREDDRRQQKRQREDDRRQQERGLAIENQRAQDEALQTYIDQIGQLLLDREQPLRQSKQGDEERTLARARTLTVLTRLKGSERKRSVVQFLFESKLITKDQAVLDLNDADLTGATLTNANLAGADLSGANLARADLNGVNLTNANLTEAHLPKANLLWAHLNGADLSGANLVDAYVKEAKLIGTKLVETKLIDATLTGADLTNATLEEADLTRANLSGTNLSGANLREADLSSVVLREAHGWTEEQLSEAWTLVGAIMPDGPTFEEWLEDREKRQQDE